MREQAFELLPYCLLSCCVQANHLVKKMTVTEP